MNSTPSRDRLQTAVAIAAAAAVVSGFAAWAAFTPDGLLRDRLSRWQFWTLELQFVVLVASSVHQLPTLARSIAATRRTWALLALTCGLCLALTSFAAPRTPRILFDEQIYQSIGRSLADTGRAQTCNDGTVEYGRLQCWNGEYNKQPYGYPYLLSVAYRLAGPAPWIAHVVNNLAAAALAAVIFLIVAIGVRDANAALAAALVLSLIPMQLQWSNAASAEPTAALACALTVLAAVHFAQTGTMGALVWTLSATTFAASFRQECVLLAGVVLIVVHLLRRHELRGPRWWQGVAVAALAGWNVVTHAVAVRNEGWGSAGERLNLAFLPHNLSTNGMFYLGDDRFPPLFTLLAIIGVVAYWRQRIIWVLALYFATFWGIFLFFYAGSYDYGADVRFSVMSNGALAALAGVGAKALLDRLRPFTGRATSRWGAVLLLFYGASHLPVVRAVGEEAWGARGDVEFVERALPALPANSIVLSHVPSIFLLRGVNAAQTSIAAGNQSRVSEFFQRYAGGVYLHWNFWCNVADPAQQVFCNDVLSQFDHELVTEQRVRNYRFAFYRLRPPPEPKTQ